MAAMSSLDHALSTTRSLRAVSACAALTAAGLVMAACAPGANPGPRYIDPDGDKGAASGLFHDIPPVDDRLDTSSGDAEDWRYIVVPRAGRISLTLYLDDPTMQGAWFLHDPQGRVVHIEAFDTDRRLYQLRDLPVLRGTYHVQISAHEGGSLYSVGSTYQGRPLPVTLEWVVPRPPVGNPDTHSVAEDGRVRGTITLVTARDDGRLEIVIRGVGERNGVTPGMTGQVAGLGVEVETTDCSRQKCGAVVEGVTMNDLRTHQTVEFMVD